MNLNEEIQTAADKFVAEKLPAMVESKVAEMMDGVLKDIFSNYGTLAKEIKTKIEEALNINLQEFDMVDYNVLVANTINEQLVRSVNENSLEPIKDLTKKIVGFVKTKEMNLSAIIEIFTDAAMEDNESEGEGEISLFIEENTQHNWIEVYADMEPNKSKEECCIKFIFSTSKDRGEIFSLYTNSWRDTLRKVTPLKLAQMSNLEHSVFRLYAARVKIIADELDTDSLKYWSRFN